MPKRRALSELYDKQSSGSDRQIDRSGVLLTENFGGLNVESSSVNMPLADSPDLMNIEITTSGVVKKRRGSKVVVNNLEKAHCLIPFKLLNGQQMCCVIDNNTVRIYKVPATLGASWTSIKTFVPFANSLCDKTSYTQYSWTITKEKFPRIIICSPNNVPIQIKLLQYPASYTEDDEEVVIPYSYGKHYENVADTFYFDEDGNSYACDALTQSSPTTTIGLATFPTTDKEGVACNFHFNWWAESILLPRKSVYDSIVHYNTNNTTDCTVELPSGMLYGLADDYEFFDGNATYEVPVLGVEEHPSSSTATYLVPSKIPSTISGAATYAWQMYYWTAGQYHEGGYATNDGGGEELNLGLTHYTFGGADAVTAPAVAYTKPPKTHGLMRLNYLPFLGGTGCASTYLHVIDNNETVFTWYSTSSLTSILDYDTYKYYGLYEHDFTTVTSSADTEPTFIAFNRTFPMGIKAENVSVSCIQVNSAYKGADCDTDWHLEEGFVEAWGISKYANYYAGEFPTIVGLFQGRVVLSGFTSNKSVLLLSNTGTNSNWSYEDYIGRNFQTNRHDPTVSTNPLEIKIPSAQDEEITDVKQWYDDLFVGTNRNVYRVHGGSSTAVTPSNYFVSTIGSVGCIKNGMLLTREGIVFLSKSGVYQIKLDSDTGSYFLEDISLKIRRHIQSGMTLNRGDKGLGYLTYDSEENVLYVAVGDFENEDIPRRLFVYHMDRKAWSEFCLFNGWFPTRHGASMDGRVWFSFKSYDTDYDTADPNGLGQSTEYASEICEFKLGTRDFVKSTTLNYAASDDWGEASYVRIPKASATWSRASFNPTGDVLIDLRKDPTSGSSLRTIPFSDDASNLVVTTDQGTLTLNTDFYKREPNYLIFLDGSFEADNAVIDVYDDDSNRSGLTVWYPAESKYLTLTDDYTVDNTNTTLLVYAADNGSGYDEATVEIGYSYPCWWFSPVFTRNDIASYKRMMYWYGLFSSVGYDAESSKFGNLVQEDFAGASPQFVSMDKFNVAVMGHGTRGGEKFTDISAADSITDVDPYAMQFNDYFKVVQHLRGNYTDFQFVIYSFNEGSFEMIGYQLDTVNSGRTSRRAYYE